MTHLLVTPSIRAVRDARSRGESDGDSLSVKNVELKGR